MDSQKLDDWSHLIKTHAWVAWTKIRKPAEYDMDDLLQEGRTVFLNACNDFNEERGAIFRTFLIGCLKNHFTSLARKSYQNKPGMDSLQTTQGRFQEEDSKHKPRGSTTLETVQISFLIQSFNPEELEYVTTILACAHISPRSRRKATRQALSISFEREVKLRNSIRDKIKK